MMILNKWKWKIFGTTLPGQIQKFWSMENMDEVPGDKKHITS
jgi:hypothetical protein